MSSKKPTTKKSSTPFECVIGDMFYRLTQRTIVRFNSSTPEGISGYDQHRRRVSFTHEQYQNLRANNDLQPLPGVRDFPNSQDPRLPYVFDLHWDAKTVQDLRAEVQNNPKSREPILECLRSFVPKSQVDLSGPNIAWDSVSDYFRQLNNEQFPQELLKACSKNSTTGQHYGGPSF